MKTEGIPLGLHFYWLLLIKEGLSIQWKRDRRGFIRYNSTLKREIDRYII